MFSEAIPKVSANVVHLSSARRSIAISPVLKSCLDGRCRDDGEESKDG